MLRVGQASVDLVTLRVNRPDGQAVLTGHEGEVVAFLAGHLGQVVSRERLEREVWGMHDAVQSEAVPVAMRRLRKKLGREAIVTVRGRGYKLVAAAAQAPTPTHPVPRAEGVFIGRDAIVQSTLKQLDLSPTVVLRGAPAVGKTRLALEVASVLHVRVVTVDLSSIGTTARAISRVADALGVGKSDASAIRRWLSTEPTALVLDDVDGLADLHAHLSEWVMGTEARILSTCIAVPNADVVSMEVPPLAPDFARQLLLMRLRAVLPHVDDDDPRLASVLAALDGLPGAIEVWAGRAGLGLDALLHDLRSSAEPLTDRLHIERLSADERHALDVLSVFGGTCLPSDAQRFVSPDALRSLRRRSVVHLTQAGELFVLGAVRRVMRPQVGPVIQAAVHHDVLKQAEHAAGDLPCHPHQAHTTLRQLRPALIDIIDTGQGEHAARAVAALARGLYRTGPKSLMRDLLDRFETRGLNESPVWGLDIWRAATLRVSSGDAGEQITLLKARREPEARLLLAGAHARLGHLDVALAVLEQLMQHVSPDSPHHVAAQVRRLLSDIQPVLPPEQVNTLARQAIDNAHRLGLPRLEQRAHVAFATCNMLDQDLALSHLHHALRLQERIGVVTTQTLEVWNALGVVHAETDPRAALLAWSQCAQLARRGGTDDTMLQVNCMLARLELREDEQVLAVPGEPLRRLPIIFVMWQIARLVSLIATGQTEEAALLELQIDWPVAGQAVTADRHSHAESIRTLVAAERRLVAGEAPEDVVAQALADTADARRIPRASLARLLARRLQRRVDLHQSTTGTLRPQRT